MSQLISKVMEFFGHVAWGPFGAIMTAIAFAYGTAAATDGVRLESSRDPNCGPLDFDNCTTRVVYELLTGEKAPGTK